MEENVSDKTEYVKDAPVDAAPIDQVRDWRADSQTPVATEFPLPVENPAPAQGFVATGSYRAPAADPNAAAPRKGGPGYFAFKRAFDIVFSAVVCAVLAVPVVAACVAIEIDSPGKPFSVKRESVKAVSLSIFSNSAPRFLMLTSTQRST